MTPRLPWRRGLALWSLRSHIVNGVFRPDVHLSHVRLEIGLAALLLYCSCAFTCYAHRRNSLAFRMLAFSLALWARPDGAGTAGQPVFEMFWETPDTCWARCRRCCWASPW